MPGEKAKDFKGTFVKLLKYMGNYKYAVLVVMLFAVGGTVFKFLGPKVLSRANTELFNGLMARIAGTGGIDFEKIGRILLLLLGLYVLSALLSFVQGYLMTGIAQKLSYRFRKEISEKSTVCPWHIRVPYRGRNSFPYYQRCGYHGTELKPEHYDTDYVPDHHHRCAGDDAFHQPPDDPDCAGDFTHIWRSDRSGHQVLPEALCGAAELSW